MPLFYFIKSYHVKIKTLFVEVCINIGYPHLWSSP